jgi:hypothetical protein
MIDALIAFDTTKIRRIKQALLIFCFISWCNGGSDSLCKIPNHTLSCLLAI